ncbi:hypothetical protein WJX84_002803 [Apatococcus fuscideae]|uniref:Serine aminopeptidase S33 domain-containing protein n=1 Tax=Apatococcus fuscideae TaxID=2026836 RepID=A0AAW1T0G0_9CHLO
MAASYQVSEATRVNRRHQKLWSVAYIPQNTRAVLVWHHGVGESNDRIKYKNFFDAFAKTGVAVHAQDAHGMGKSEPFDKADRIFVRKVDDLIDDAEDFATEMRSKYPATMPFYVGGVSMGGMITTLLTLRDQKPWSGMMLQSAAINVEKNFMQKVTEAIAGLLNLLMPRARIVPAVPPEYLSKDPQVRKETVDDPYTVIGNMRVATGLIFLDGFSRIAQKGSTLSLPIFAIHGTDDKVTSPKAVQQLLDGCAALMAKLRT